jgi:hypothetical protein
VALEAACRGEAASELLWPWIGEMKRTQLLRAARDVGRITRLHSFSRWSPDEEAAWAAGFFDGEGTIGIERDPRRPAVTMEIPQASATTVPETLVRFRRFVGAGNLSGRVSSRARGRSSRNTAGSSSDSVRSSAWSRCSIRTPTS